ncbi:hypothetical protein BH23ACT11_BH23ACT11_16560 [soil metagenome]
MSPLRSVHFTFEKYYGRKSALDRMDPDAMFGTVP